MTELLNQLDVRVVAYAFLGALAIVCGVVGWLWRKSDQQYRLIREMQTLIADLTDHADPQDLFNTAGLSPRLRAFRDHIRAGDQEEARR